MRMRQVIGRSVLAMAAGSILAVGTGCGSKPPSMSGRVVLVTSATPTQAEADGRLSPLHLAALRDDLAAAKGSATFATKTSDLGRLALHYAHSPTMVAYLLGLGSDPNRADKAGLRPIDLAPTVEIWKQLDTAMAAPEAGRMSTQFYSLAAVAAGPSAGPGAEQRAATLRQALTGLGFTDMGDASGLGAPRQFVIMPEPTHKLIVTQYPRDARLLRLLMDGTPGMTRVVVDGEGTRLDVR